MIHTDIVAPHRARRKAGRRTSVSVFRWPVCFALASLAGLVLGLTGDGVRDWAAWVLLGSVPLFIAVAFWRRSVPLVIPAESLACTCATRVCPCSPSSLPLPAQPMRNPTNLRFKIKATTKV